MKKQQSAALDRLASLDHAILYPKSAYEIADALGVAREHVPVYEVRDTRSEFKGATMKGLEEGESAEAVAADVLAESLCQALGIKTRDYFGRGTRLREAVRQLREHFA